MFEQAKSIFIIGIKGVAMANLAVILKKMRKNVTGADLEEEFITDELLKKNNISYSIGFSPTNLPNRTDLVIYSAAHGGTDNALAIEAKKRGINIISQVELLAELIKQFKTKIAVSGCHGKTTTSALLSYALIQLGEKPSYLIGAPSFNEFSGGTYESNKYFVVEADEYGVNPPDDVRPKFHFLKSDYIICTNIDFDHPDVYRNLQSTKESFLKFFACNKLIVCSDDSNLMSVVQKLSRTQYQTFGFEKKSDFVISNLQTKKNGTDFQLSVNNALLGKFTISLFGEKNVSNATSVIVMLLTLGFPVEKIQKAIKNFTGATRRFEKIFENKDYSLFDDYGHHPNEIQATIEAAKKHFPNRRIVVIFQPHTYSRTQILLKDFAQALSLADHSYILPIFPSAREDKSSFSVKAEDIVKHSNTHNLSYVDDHVQLIKRLNKEMKKGDVIFTMGAGDVYKLKDEIIRLIQNSKLTPNQNKFGSGLPRTVRQRRSGTVVKIEKDRELFPYLTLRTRVKAEYFREIKSREELITARKYATEKNIPFFMLGGGSNLALTKKILNGLVVKNSYQKFEIISENDNSVELLVSSGYPVSRLVQQTVESGYEGFEYQKGLPGTVGGAIYMNSKWIHPLSYFSDKLIYVQMMDAKGVERKEKKEYFQFAYDYSVLQKTKEIVLEAIFHLEKVSPDILEKRANDAFEYRLKTQPFGVATSGCFFRNIPQEVQKEKNLPTTSAGYLIDKAGLKDYIIGDFIVSDKHANFILNKGNGKSKDLIKLISEIKNKVKEKFGVELEEEVILV